MRHWSLIIVSLFCLSSFSFAQEKQSSPVEDLTTALIAAKTDEERAALLAAKKELVTAELPKALLAQGDRQRSQGNYSKALTIYALAQSISEQIGDKAGIAAALNKIGNVHSQQGIY